MPRRYRGRGTTTHAISPRIPIVASILCSTGMVYHSLFFHHDPSSTTDDESLHPQQLPNVVPEDTTSEILSRRPTARMSMTSSADTIQDYTVCSNNGQLLFDSCICNVGWEGQDCSQPWHRPPSSCDDSYNDQCFFHPDYGVAKMSMDRWRGAQKAETATWAEQRTSDRNEEHAQNFENYATLVWEHNHKQQQQQQQQQLNVFGNMIEFGAGPFTQSLTIFESSKIDPESITLLEPLADVYKATVHACRYKDGRLGHLPLESLKVLPIAAEELDADQQQYDSILLLNFVEHVQDAIPIYRTAFDALKVGGIVIFHERYWPGYSGRETKNHREYDLHPIRLNERFAYWMATEFDLLYEKEQNERRGNLGYYWIGRKRAVPMKSYLDRLSVRMETHANMLLARGFDEKNIWGNIYNGKDLEQSREYMSYARNPNVKTICEVGFAGGHSTVAYLTANPNATIYSFDDFGKASLTRTAHQIIRRQGNVFLTRGDSTRTVLEFAATHPDVYCDIISVDGAHHAHFPDVDLRNFKYLANYPNVVLIDDYHKVDWPAVTSGVENRIKEGSMKLRHVAASSIIFRDKQKQWAIGEYTLVTVVCASNSLERLLGLKGIVDVASTHPAVQQVIIVWQGAELPQDISDLARPPVNGARVTIEHREQSSLNWRYDPKLPVHTGAVMLVDDDLVIEHSTISCALNAWKRDPSVVYSFGKEGRSVSSNGYLGYDVYGGLPKDDPRTNFLLPRIIFHRDYMSLYFDQENQKLRDYVDEHEAHCDDIAFASVITKRIGKPLHYIPANYVDGRATGLGQKENRLELRHECAKEIVAMTEWTMPSIVVDTC